MLGQPFLDWLHRVDPTSVELSLEDLRREPTIYLLPECENEEAAREYLREVCGEIFEEQLNGWYRVPTAWPVRRDFEVFVRWLEYRFHSMLVDLCDDLLIHEETRTPPSIPATQESRAIEFLDVTAYRRHSNRNPLRTVGTGVQC